MDIVRFSGGGGIAFFARATQVVGMKDWSISVQAETEDKTSGGEKYKSKKNSGGYQAQLTAVLNLMLGVDVQTEALKITEAARKGESGYLYCGENKLLPAPFMLDDAKITQIVTSPRAEWISCEVAMTFHQCGKYEGAGEDDGGKKSGKKSKKSRGWKRGVNNVLGDLVNDPALSRDSIIKGNAARLKSKAKREVKRRNAIALSGGTTRLAEYR